MNKDKEVEKEQQECLRLGFIAEEGLKSEFWLLIVKPIIDSQIKGATDIMSVNISSEKRASIELAGRILAARYLTEVSTFVDGFVIDAETVRKIQDKQKKGNNLYREV